MGETSCGVAGGTFIGTNTQCATSPPCPQPGACCMPEGGCEILSELQCFFALGVYHGNGSTCAAANCPGGACCLPDGTCIFTVDATCTSEFGGTFWGDGTTCGDQRCATEPLLWNNGPMVTSPGQGCAGGDASLLETGLGTTVYGFGWAAPTVAIADSFIVPDGENWLVNEIIFWGYQTGAQTATINHLAVQIWDGVPGETGSSVIAGDINTSCLTSASLTNMYRSLSTDPANCDRRQQELPCNLSASLGSGTYWVEATTMGTGASGPWISPVKFINRPAKPFATGMQRTAAGWAAAMDNDHRQSIPFHIVGAVGDACYADCNGDEILTVDDFTCFINAFAAASALPPAQQVNHYANCDGSTNEPILTVDDFTCFINEFAAGCP